MRLGFLTHLHIGDDAAHSYRLALELFEAAEALGYDSGWVAQHHFLNGGGRLPSTFSFLAAAAERTKRIQLGSAIVILPLEDALRVAEDAAVVDIMSGGRLQLGLGTGGDPLTFSAFGLDADARRGRYAEGMQVIGEALAGRPVRGTTATMYPPNQGLASRLWESTLSPEGGARIGAGGNGLLLARTAFLSSEPTDVAQLPVAQAYLEALARRNEARDRSEGADMRGDSSNGANGSLGQGASDGVDNGAAGKPVKSRIGLSRAVYPADDRRTAMAHLEKGVAAYVDSMIQQGHFPRGLSQEGYFRRTHIHYGHPEEVAASLQADRLLPMTTDLICQVQPGHPTPDQMVRALERIAKEVAPALGWRPAASAR